MDLSKDSWIKYFESIGEKTFKATQAIEWLYDKKEYNPNNWSNFKSETRNILSTSFNNITVPSLRT